MSARAYVIAIAVLLLAAVLIGAAGLPPGPAPVSPLIALVLFALAAAGALSLLARSHRGHAAAIALLLLAALLTLYFDALLIPAILVALAVGDALWLVARWRPERIALVLAVVVVASGAVAAGVDVIDGIEHSRVEYRGELDAQEILRSVHPEAPDDPRPEFERMGVAYLTSADGVMTVPRRDADTLALWSIQELAPWLLAAIILAVLAPILRATERGDPFWRDATRRLTAVGALLLVGIPAIALMGYIVGQSTTSWAGPSVEPTLSLSFSQILPGVLVLALARIFHAGAELRDLERRTI